MTRIDILKNIIIFLFVLIITALFNVQVIKGSYFFSLSENNRIRILPQDGPRGRILDRKGIVLVDNRIVFDVAIVPQEVEDLGTVLLTLSKYLGLAPEEVRGIYKKNYYAPFTPVVIRQDIDENTAFQLEEIRDDFPGLIVQVRPQRYYINNSVASHILGYVGKITAQDLKLLRFHGYNMRDIVGKSGIEKIYDSHLRGVRGGTQIEVDSRGKRIRILGAKEPQKGSDITLTIDVDIEKLIDQALAGKKGAITVMDLASGDILAMASAPDFDPNVFALGKSIKINEILTDSSSPFLNRNFDLNCAYPPGSTFKIITATAALESKKITTNTYINCSGKFTLGNHTFYCWKRDGHGEVSVTSALKYSCNVFFYNTGLFAGPIQLAAYAKKFGLGRATGLADFMEEKGHIPDVTGRWFKGDTVNFSIGQGYLLATPLQVLVMGSIVANNGKMVTPRIVKTNEKPKMVKLDISEQTLKVVHEGMKQVVASVDGTGRRAGLKGATLIAKTGTAQASSGDTHAWFIGFTPEDSPRIGIVIFLEHGGHGGEEAADIAASICELLKSKNYV